MKPTPTERAAIAVMLSAAALAVAAAFGSAGVGTVPALLLSVASIAAAFWAVWE